VKGGLRPDARQRNSSRMSHVSGRPPAAPKQYDYLLKVLLVGDSDVGKQEILQDLEDGSAESPFCSGNAYKTTTILLDGKRVKLQLWDTSGQGRFCTIIRSYSRGAQGILLVYDITNKWSFDSIERWLEEVDKVGPAFFNSFNPRHSNRIISACTGRPKSTRRKPSTSRLQEASGRTRGRTVCSQEPYGIFRGQPALRFQHSGKLLRAFAHGTSSKRNGEALAQQPR
jgi:hypothetical protein